jgi:hypothetical protein
MATRFRGIKLGEEMDRWLLAEAKSQGVSWSVLVRGLLEEAIEVREHGRHVSERPERKTRAERNRRRLPRRSR